ncbi:hypothetical protein EC957_009870 [Mortierella hygrophila]|uniref:Uncharacterized protein n=1 Tax=Mortierella hygrophila TaxID=979708 RepID=A0A9P6EWM4_9FUNG|nr:hypothetical protein EC957_009870 [Mortierella hygrophila]
MASPDTIKVNLANQPGECVTVPYTADEPVYNIIQRVAMELQETKTDFNYQELYLQGFHLEYPQLSLANYRVLGGTLTYQSIKKGDMSVFVKTLSGGKSLCIGCNPSDSVLDLKKILFKREGVPLGQMQLQHHGKILDDDDTLESRGIRRMSTLTMSTYVRGGLGMNLVAPIKFADVSNSGNVQKLRVSYGGPPERIVRPGTNVEVKCLCTPKHDVIVPFRFGIIELSQEKFPCPKCEKEDKTVPVTVGFFTCKYRFLGIKANSTQFTTDWTNVDKFGEYQQFDPKKQIGWSRLVIESAPLDGEDDCPLCLKQMDDEDEVETLDCGHRFHEACQTRRYPDTACSSCDFQHVLLNNKKSFLGGLRLRLSQ